MQADIQQSRARQKALGESLTFVNPFLQVQFPPLIIAPLPIKKMPREPSFQQQCMPVVSQKRLLAVRAEVKGPMKTPPPAPLQTICCQHHIQLQASTNGCCPHLYVSFQI